MKRQFTVQIRTIKGISLLLPALSLSKYPAQTIFALTRDWSVCSVTDFTNLYSNSSNPAIIIKFNNILSTFHRTIAKSNPTIWRWKAIAYVENNSLQNGEVLKNSNLVKQ
jgi:hypothetical protein